MFPPKLKTHLAKLQEKKYRKQCGEFVVEGSKGVVEALKSDYDVLALIIDGKRREEPDIALVIDMAEKKNTEVFFCGRKDIGEIKTTDTFPGVQAIVASEEVSLEDLDFSEPIIFLDSMNDPGNLGTIIRTADWFGVPNVIVSEGSVDLSNPKVVRSTMGSLFHTTIFESPNGVRTLEYLKKKGYSIIGLDTKGKPLGTFKPTKKQVYIFGSESHGIRKEIQPLIDHTIAIPGRGRAESLNVGVAVGVVLSSILGLKS